MFINDTIEKLKKRMVVISKKLAKRQNNNPRKFRLKARFAALEKQLNAEIKEAVKDLPVIEKEQVFKTDVSFNPEGFYVDSGIDLG